MGVSVCGVESAGSPEEVADIHEETIEIIHMIARVFVVRCHAGDAWALSWAHSGFEGTFVGCENGAEAGKRAEGGIGEREEVDCWCKGGRDPDVRGLWGMRDGVGESFVVGKNGRSGCEGGRDGCEEGE